jgi:hypothetical protein
MHIYIESNSSKIRNMKNRLIYIALALFQMYKIYAQTPVCLPDLKYKDSTGGIYPKPYNDSTKLGGISQVACIDQPYEVPLTVNIPDMVTIPFGGILVTLGLESARLDTANAVVGLPKGLTYFCSTANCVYDKNKLGCIVIKGTPTSANKPGNYDLVINLKLVTNLGTFDVSFPGPIFPGKYFITVAEKNSGACKTSGYEALSSFQGDVVAYPNPVRNHLKMKISALKPGSAQLSLTDITGKVLSRQQFVLNQGNNEYEVPVINLSNGIYFYTLNQQARSTTRRFMVLKN